jgi:ribonuclease PH
VRSYTDQAPGSVLVESGRTRVLCTVSINDHVPQWLQGNGQGWLTAEYSMLPGSTRQRKPRDGRNGRIDGRSQEIQRLIGRSLRAVLDMKAMPEVTLWVDCDVLQADGGTRSAAINGACVGLHDALTHLEAKGQLRKWPMLGMVSAMSVGMVKGTPMVDLDYKEDSAADVDMNLVYLSDGRMVEVQGSAEGTPFAEDEFQSLVNLARSGCENVLQLQKQALEK